VPHREIAKLTSTTSSQEETLSHYLIEKVIGKGGFSKVLLVRHKVTGLLYAMKVMRKDKIKKDNKVAQIMTERRILETLQAGKHPFIVKIHSAFQSVSQHVKITCIQTHYLHFVLEFCAGGELFFLISKHRKFPEAVAKFYFVEIMLALEYLHKHNIMYRDLKVSKVTHHTHASVAREHLAGPFGACEVDRLRSLPG
jgi:serine/threonine protein kinase